MKKFKDEKNMASNGKVRERRWPKCPSNRILMSLIGVIGVIGLGLMGGSWLIAFVVLHPPTQSTGQTPADPPGLYFDEISFTTMDGLVLRGWFLPGRAGATVILVHGFARDRTELLPEARWLVEMGFGALLFDSRAQGSSDGSHISLGYQERLDVRAAVDFVLRSSPEERIGVMGYSMGGIAAIEAAAENPRIRAVIAVSPFASLNDALNRRLKLVRPLAALIIWWGERMTGLHLDDLRPTAAVAALSPRPILVMEAGDDAMIPPNSGQRLYEAAGEPKELWSVPAVAHVDFRQALPEAYKRRVLRFFERYLMLDE
jgi:alpha-beta hydrolase superfamily lysophospholipase